jgi:hypothetical protein
MVLQLNTQGSVQKVTVDNAHSLLILFDRSVSFSSNSNTQLQFFFDEVNLRLVLFSVFLLKHSFSDYTTLTFDCLVSN